MTESTSPSSMPQLVDITAVAKILGVDARHVRRLVYERRIPFIKWGHLIRFDPDEIKIWLNSNRTPVGGQPPTPAPVRSLPHRRPTQAEPSDPSPRDQLRFEQ